ncbi:MAG: thiosulfohydrolase SoxB [Proteobacteria bacterium]|nr:thiosulfohydrolase SoxB [Pseudomonadota bacterium]
MGLTRRAMLAGAGAGALAGRARAATDPAAANAVGGPAPRGPSPAIGVRILHITDTHAQAAPVRFREPAANIGVGAARGRPPHLVGEAFLQDFHLAPGTSAAHAFTFLDFERLAHRYGPLGGFAHLKTLIDALRAEAGPGRSLLVDGGDLTQGSGLANLTRGQDMVALANLLGTEVMTGHWEFTYGEAGLRALLAAYKGSFVAQNVFLTDEAAFANAPAFDAASGRVFPPYVIRELGGHPIAVIGQAFPYVPIAHPKRLTPDWTFGIHPHKLQAVVDEVRGKHKVDAVLLLSHNGMDVDLALAARVRGIDVILGGHTHDAVPVPQVVGNPGGRTFVTNAGTAGKFVAVLDLSLARGRLVDLRYRLLPVFAEQHRADPAMAAAIAHWRAPHAAMLGEELAEVGPLLYRRGNFTGSMDQVICDALRTELDAEIVLSPGFRWGNSFLPGHKLTMEDLLSETAITYPSVYVQTMTGAALKGAMEDVCDNLFNRNPFYQQGGDMVRLGGMDYACAPREKIGNRISAMTLNDGTAIEASKSYKVAGWASVSLPQDREPVWDVVARHLRRNRHIVIPRPNRVKLIGVAGNPGYAAT